MGSRWLTKAPITDSNCVLILFLLIVVLLLLAPRDQVRPCAPQCESAANALFRRQAARSSLRHRSVAFYAAMTPFVGAFFSGFPSHPIPPRHRPPLAPVISLPPGVSR